MNSRQAVKGMVAAGHDQTAAAAREILQSGGNAFDAVIAAMAAACVAEPILASLGGGGFLLAHTPQQDLLYDFFTHTPRRKRPTEGLDFYPIHADFGSVKQEFHIGRGSIAVPGVIKGMFEIHKDLCRLSMNELLAPAIRLAREGVKVNGFQAYIFEVIAPILHASPEATRLFADPDNPDKIISQGKLRRCSELADFLERLAHEGENLFYQGELAHQIAGDLSKDGHLSLEDLTGYRVCKRPPLSIAYRRHRILTNPYPSSGGILIAVALKLFESIEINDTSDTATLLLNLAQAMEVTDRWRHRNTPFDEHAPLPESLKPFQSLLQQRQPAHRGTTHISVADEHGNLAALTLSNGEGSGYVVPGTGIMLNNMLGEEDLNKTGFHHWQPGQRLSSMMAPSVIEQDNGLNYAIGSGGSNRIRTALFQVIVNLLDLELPLSEAIHRPRLHLETNQLNIEPGYASGELKPLLDNYPDATLWPTHNLFFGGVHGVAVNPRTQQLSGCGDNRRGGVFISA